MGSHHWSLERNTRETCKKCNVKMVKSMSGQFCGIVMLFLASTVSCYDDDISLYEEDASDPRVFFANYTSGLLAVNTTILAYAGIIVAAGVVVGLVLYFIATNPQSRYFSNAYGNSQYYSQARMLYDMGSSVLGEDWNLMGLITKALDVYNKLNDEHED